MGTRFAGVVTAPLAAMVGGTGCLLELEQAISCGDGFVDLAAGEECEPELPETFLSACEDTNRREGVGACDPATCMIINDPMQCGVCGDGIVDADLGEECDGQNLNGKACSGSDSSLQCGADCRFDFSECDPCGNGELDAGEECEVTLVPGFGGERACAGGDGQPGLQPLVGTKDYASGTTSRCLDCKWDRSSCGFCGDGQRDVAPLLAPSVNGPTEWCDGADKDRARLEERFSDTFWCPLDDEIPNAACVDTCDDFELRDPPCCKQSGARCPRLVDEVKCCYAYDHPEDPTPCQFVGSGGLDQRCR